MIQTINKASLKKAFDGVTVARDGSRITVADTTEAACKMLQAIHDTFGIDYVATYPHGTLSDTPRTATFNLDTFKGYGILSPKHFVANAITAYFDARCPVAANGRQ